MLEGNLTGGQIQEVMDRLLYDALAPVIRYTNVFDTQLVYLLATVTKNKKRKVCAVSRPETIDFLCKALATSDPEEKMMYIKKLKIERSFIHVFLKRFVQAYKGPIFSLYYQYMSDTKNRQTYAKRMKPYLASVGCSGRSEIFIAITSCESSLTRFYHYFDRVISQYYKLCYLKAKGLVDTNPNNNYDFHDLVQNLRQRTITALNKYDASNGALTSYIKWWLFNSLTCGSGQHEYGLAYTVPQNVKRKLMQSDGSGVNFSVSMDSLLSESDDNESSNLHNMIAGETPDLDDEIASISELNRMYKFAKNADPHGIARLSLELPEVFSPTELATMRKTTVL